VKEFVTELRVRGYEMDSFGHVNHATYLSYLEQARWDALEGGGFTPADLYGQGWGIHVVRAEVDYMKPCQQGHLLRILSWPERLRSTSMVFAHEIYRDIDGAEAGPAVAARVTLVWIGPGGRPMRIPDVARRALGG
jgi:YbgC/YbaW family acyl-CoA thioester hydrolase